MCFSLAVKQTAHFKVEAQANFEKKKEKKAAIVASRHVTKIKACHKGAPKGSPSRASPPVTSDTGSYFPIFTVFHLNFHSVSWK